jgi:uncharacterized SAM-binding protein YcdF (DUF218 family)
MTPPDDKRDEAAAARSAARRRRLGSSGWLFAGAFAAVATGALVLAVGFLWFLLSIPNDEVAIERDSDGIVVLTGGASRIADAVELLATGRGKRLLITGVNRTTTSGEIARLMPRYERWFACCVDLDYAVNTIGNAVETRRWAKDKNFHSLIIVTSGYHMPRAMTELARQLPDAALVPFPVVTEKLRTEPWWSSMPTAKLLFVEYLKYMLAQIRLRLDLDEATDVAGNRNATRS